MHKLFSDPAKHAAAGFGIATPIAVVLVWGFRLAEIEVPPEVGAAMGTLLSYVLGRWRADA